MSNKRISIKVGSEVLSILGVTLVVLKLAGVINCSWWAVLAPFFIPIVILLMWLVLIIIFSLIFRS